MATRRTTPRRSPKTSTASKEDLLKYYREMLQIRRYGAFATFISGR